jgi:hypothetical protein
MRSSLPPFDNVNPLGVMALKPIDVNEHQLGMSWKERPSIDIPTNNFLFIGIEAFLKVFVHMPGI